MLPGVISETSRRAFPAILSCFWLLTFAAAVSQPAVSPTIRQLERAFAEPPADSRIMVRWWWFGPAVTKSEIDRELHVMREGGIGGVEIQPVYPLSPDNAVTGITNLPFLSDRFIDTLRFASATARELGLRVDLTVGSGWPYGGPTVRIDEAAARLRIERATAAAGSTTVRLPAISAGESLIAAFTGSAELTDIDRGTVRLPGDSKAARDVVFFISSRTGQQVKRPAVGAEGFVVDHLSRPALTSYLSAVGDRLLQAFGPVPPYAVFCDSLEVYGSDWSSDFLDEFRRRRGYDLKPHLPELVTSHALRDDWGRTLTELLNERFLAPIQAWAHAHGTRFRAQAYGTPPATISSYASADLPEGEGAQWKTLSATRWASSASHIYGVPVTSSETWTWLHSPVFRATPLDMKAEADLHFLQGINQLIGHGWPYTAEGVEYPGWRFYASGVFDDKNPWWIVMPDVTRYLQRLSFLLRQGNPVNDVAVYLPDDDAWAQMSPGRVNLIETLRERLGPKLVARIVEAGLGLDFFDDDILRTKGSVDPGGRLRLGANTYRAVILPNVERMPLATLLAIEEFARGGGIVIATRRLPSLAPGFAATTADHEQVRTTAQRIFQGTPTARSVEDEDAQLGSVLTNLLPPDVSFSRTPNPLGFVHRRTGDADVYFLVNTSNTRQQGTATFRITGVNAERWDPMTGLASPADVHTSSAGTSMDLMLDPYASAVVVFSKGPRRHAASPQPRQEAPTALDISANWRVSFGQGRAIAMEQLRSWTDDPSTRNFSGVAIYEKDVSVPDTTLRGATTVRLDFGEGHPAEPQPLRSGMQAWLEAPVREAAIVFVNDQRAGVIWCPPYAVDVTKLLRPGVNRIRVSVANLAVNYMAGRALPDYRLLNLRYGARFEAQDMDKIQPVPSGLFGPIRLTVTRP